MTEIGNISPRFFARRLSEKDAAAVYALESGNADFFALTFSSPSAESFWENLAALPPGKGYKDKYYIGFFDGGRLIAEADLIAGYPDGETAYIGLFMLDKTRQGAGEGSRLAREIFRFFKESGYLKVKIGVIEGSEKAAAFWKKNGFAFTGERVRKEGYAIAGMIKYLV